MSVLKSLGYRAILKLVCLYGDIRPTRVGVSAVVGCGVVIVVCTDAIKSLARAEHIVVDSGVVILIAVLDTASVEHFKGVHALVLHIVGVVLKRPGGVIVGHEKALFPARSYHIVDALGRKHTDVLPVFVLSYLGYMIARVAPHVFFVPAGLSQVILLKCDEADMTALLVSVLIYLLFVYRRLKAVEGEKAIVIKLGVRNHNLMLRISNYRKAELFIYILYLGGSSPTVREGGVAMKICLIEVSVLGQNKFFHDHSPLQSYFYNAIIIAQISFVRN